MERVRQATPAWYQRAKYIRKITRIQLAVQDRLQLGESITWNDLKRKLASNEPAALFKEAIEELADVGIVELSRPHVQRGPRPILITYKGYAHDRPEHTEEAWLQHVGEGAHGSYEQFLNRYHETAGQDTDPTEEE